MKKLFSIMALLGVLSAFAVGCGEPAKKTTTPAPATTTPAKSTT